MPTRQKWEAPLIDEYDTKNGGNMGIVLDIHTMVSDRECTKLRFLVDTGATECLIRQDVVPWLSVRSRDNKSQ